MSRNMLIAVDKKKSPHLIKLNNLMADEIKKEKEKEDKEREDKKRKELEEYEEQQIEKENAEKDQKATEAFILRMTNAEIEAKLKLRKNFKTTLEGFFPTRKKNNDAEIFEKDNAFMRETAKKRQEDEDEATDKKILEMDATLIKKYLRFRTYQQYIGYYGARRLGVLGTRKFTDTKESYDEDTLYMRKRLKKVENEDEATKRFIDKMTIGQLQDYIEKRKKWTVFGKEKRSEGKLQTRKMANTANNFNLDTIYLVKRLENRIGRFKDIKTVSQENLKSIRSYHSSSTLKKVDEVRPPSEVKKEAEAEAKPPSKPKPPSAPKAASAPKPPSAAKPTSAAKPPSAAKPTSASKAKSVKKSLKKAASLNNKASSGKKKSKSAKRRKSI